MKEESASKEIWASIIWGKKRGWVAAILCRDAKHLREYLKQYPAKFRKHGTICPLSQTEFPIFIVERLVGEQTFSFVSRSELDAVIKGIDRDRGRELQSERGDFTYLNLYQVTGEWLPEPPGHDHLGDLDHLHADGEMLDRLAKEGWEFFDW